MLLAWLRSDPRYFVTNSQPSLGHLKFVVLCLLLKCFVQSRWFAKTAVHAVEAHRWMPWRDV